MINPFAPALRHQDFACLVAIDPDTAQITHASRNCDTVLGHAAETLLDANARDALGREVWHSFRNAASRPDFAAGSVPMIGIGDSADPDTPEMRAFAVGPLHLIETSPALPSEFGSTPVLDVVQTAMSMLLNVASEQELADVLARLLRHFSSYDQIAIWRRDQHDKGRAAAIAEAKRGSRDSLLGVTADWGDLWAADLASVDIVADTDAAMIPILSSGNAPALGDLRLARSRPVLADQLAHLSHDGSRAQIRMRLSCNGSPWAVADCRSTMARRPSSAFLSLMEVLSPFIDVKLQALGGS